jgi:hypothetical protein
MKCKVLNERSIGKKQFGVNKEKRAATPFSSLRATPAEAGGAWQSLCFRCLRRLPLGRKQFGSELIAEGLQAERLRSLHSLAMTL